MSKEELIKKLDAVKQVCKWQEDILDYQMNVKKQAREYYNNILMSLKDLDKDIETMNLICAYVNRKTAKITICLDAISLVLMVAFSNFLIPIVVGLLSSCGFIVINTFFETKLLKLKEFKLYLKRQQDYTYEELDVIDESLRKIKDNLKRCENLMISYDGNFKELEEVYELDLVTPVEIKSLEELSVLPDDGLVRLLKK